MGVRTVFRLLMENCEDGNPDVMSRLVQVPGLDINYQDERGQTAALLACNLAQTECVKILAETDRVDWNKADMGGGTLLFWALERGHSDTLAQAAVRGGDVKCVDCGDSSCSGEMRL